MVSTLGIVDRWQHLMTESRLDLALHTILVRVGEEWLDVRFVDGHRGLQSAAWVIHNRATETNRAMETQRRKDLEAEVIREVEEGLSCTTFPRCLCPRNEPGCPYRGDDAVVMRPASESPFVRHSGPAVSRWR